jgi:Flp pilus assembly protein TadG
MVAFRSAKGRGFRGAKGDTATGIDSPVLNETTLMKSTRQNSPRRRCRRHRRGMALVFAALLLVGLMTLCALTVDIGYMCVARAELQRSADAAALAGVAVMRDVFDLNSTPYPFAVANASRTAACRYSELNPCRSVTVTLPRNDANMHQGDLVLGHYNSTSGVFDPGNTKYNSAYVHVRRDSVQNGPVELFVAPVFGVHSVDMSMEAAAYMETDVKGFQVDDGDHATCKLLPFTLQIDLWEARRTNGIDQFTHNATNNTVSPWPDGIFEIDIYPGKVAPGNFGTIDIGNENNATPDISRQIRFGPNAYDLSFFPDNTIQLGNDGILTLNGETGISAAIKDDLAAIVGQPRILPLHATMRGNGDNAYFDIVAFVGVTVLDVKLTGAMNKKYLKIQPCYTVDGTALGGGSDGTTSRFIRTPPRLRKVR